MVTLTPAGRTVPHFVENERGTTLRLKHLSDRSLVGLLVQADDLAIVAPGRAEPSAAMCAFARRLEQIRAQGPAALMTESLIYPELGFLEPDLGSERRALARDDECTLVAGWLTRAAANGERTIAVVAFVPQDLSACDLTLALS